MDAQPHKVLIVDDEPVITETLKAIFSRNGYQARAANSPREALAVVNEWMPNLAVIDVCLFGVSGIELAIRLKEEYPGCHFLLFSGRTEAEDLLADAAARGHTFAVMAKPVHPDEMLASARRMLLDAQSVV